MDKFEACNRIEDGNLPMASKILSSDAFLSSLAPSEINVLNCVSKELNTAVCDYRASQKNYTVTNDLFVNDEKDNYANYPNIEHLKYRVSYWIDLNDYLRPTLKSLHLELDIHIVDDPRIVGMYISNSGAICKVLSQIREFRDKYPDALQEISITADPNVSITFVIPDGIIDGYDRYGPKYEDDEWTEKTSEFPVAAFLASLDPVETTAIKAELDLLIGSFSWKKLDIATLFDTKDIPSSVVWKHITELYNKPKKIDWTCSSTNG